MRRTASGTHRFRVVLMLLLAMGLLALVEAEPAGAAFPGQNGKITYARYGGGSPGVRIYIVNPDGTEQKQLYTNGTRPKLSPDGTQVAFTGWGLDGDDFEIFTIPVGGGSITNVTNNNTHESGPAWSPDGTQIAYSRDSDGGLNGDEEIWTQPVAGGGATRLTANNIPETEPDWSPDGKTIAYMSRSTFNGWEIWTRPATGGPPTNVTNDRRHDMNPSWSPDGTKIAYAHDDGNDLEIYVAPADPLSGDPVPLTNNAQNDVNPAWSPDGKRIAYTNWGQFNLLTMPAAGGAPTEVPNTSGAWFPDWGPAPAQTFDEKERRRISYGDWFFTSDNDPDPSNQPLFSNGYASYSVSRAAVTFTFTGTSITWKTIRDRFSGITDVYLDGVKVKTFDGCSPDFYNNRYDVTGFTRSGLANSNHTIRLVNTGTKNADCNSNLTYLDRFIVNGNTSYEDNDWRITYQPWKGISDSNASGGTYRESSSITSAARICCFTGPRVELVTAKGPTRGQVRITVLDYITGAVVKTVTQDLYSSTTQWKAAVPVTGLDPTKAYNLTVTSYDGKPLVVDAFNAYPAW